MRSHELLDPSHPGIGPALAEFTRRIAVDLSIELPELPSFPEVVVRVRDALSKDDVAVDDVVRIVGAEPSLSVRLLQLSNSAALNPSGKRVSTLRAAIARLGFTQARSATVVFAMSQMRRAEAWRGLEPQFRDIWDASARLAATSYALARHCRRADADQAMLAGMLSAVGRLFILVRLSTLPALIADAAIYDEIQSVWQARAGRALLARWDLGSEMLDAASDFDNAHSPHGGRATLSDVLLASRYLVGVADPAELPGMAFLEAPPFLRLGLDAQGAAAVLSASAGEIASLRAALAD
ncbi:MAG TPA: HDOD domain-containing protein [Steroidobacteraceae bacterium]